MAAALGSAAVLGPLLASLASGAIGMLTPHGGTGGAAPTAVPQARPLLPGVPQMATAAAPLQPPSVGATPLGGAPAAGGSPSLAELLKMITGMQGGR